MAQPSRLALLPGYDTAPDIYESTTSPTTTTTTQRTSPHSPSDTDSTSRSDDSNDDDEDDESYGISRRRLYPERARQRFHAGAGRVDTRNVDWSDRVDGARKGYRVKGGHVEEDEGLEAKIARLRREVEECRMEAEKERKDEGGEGDEVAEVDGLSKLLASIDMPSTDSRRRRASRPTPLPDPDELEDEPTNEKTLTQIADFDARLSSLESALGLSSLDAAAATSNPNTTSAPLLPSLAILDQQLSALNQATSLTALENARSRLRSLPSQPQESSSEESLLSETDMQNLPQLYTLLPTLHSLAPTVPALLSRLRSLRALHTTAANAGEALEGVEQAQAEMGAELKAWREGLEKVEGAVREASEANGKNGGMVRGWVEELQGRVERLGR